MLHEISNIQYPTQETGTVIFDVLAFSVLAAITLLSALAMIASRNAIHAALFLVVNFSAIAVLYLALNAPFLAMVQIAVYAGAIMVLFLFVIMLLGAERLEPQSRLEWQHPLAILLALALLVEGGYLFFERLGSGPEIAAALADSSPRAVAEVLFNRYLFPFEVTSVLLLVAMVGAVVLTLDKKEEGE
jgi:NADH-quinone oxidoreductase subunit J